jgi:glycine cleavage system transcriptional repressor
MAKYVSLTAIGKDRPGLVSSITKILYEEKCNVEDSTMTILHGQFAMILIIEIPRKLSANALFNKLQKSSKSLGMVLSYAKLSSYAPKKHMPSNPYIISVYGSDKTGIVYKVSEYLAENKINITDVQTTLSKSKGKDTYIMIIECDIAKKKSYEKVSKDLSKLSELINVTISLNRAESADI